MCDRVRSFAELIRDGLIEIGAGRPRTVSLSGYDLPILRVADVLNGRIDYSLQAHISRDDVKGDVSKVSRPGDIVLTTKGTVGRVALIPSGGPVFSYSPQLCFFRPLAGGPLRSRFLYYWFSSAEFWAQANALKAQTDMADFLSLGDLQRMRVTIPSLGRQDAIAATLGALDDKIAANGALSGLVDDLLAAEFCALVQGRATGVLSDIGAVNRAVVKPSVEGSLRYLDISGVARGSYVFPEVSSWKAAPGRARREVKFGDTVWSTVRPNRRSHALILDDDPLLIASTGLAVLSPKSGRVASLYEATKTDKFANYLESVAEGSAYPAVKGDLFACAPIPALHREEWDRFESLAMPLRQRVHAAVVESRSLSVLRDVLLPPLMSGKVRVREAEMLVEAV